MLNRRLLPLLLALVLAACGFHLRGPVELPPVLKETRIIGLAEFSPLNLELKKVLTNAGATVLPMSAKSSSTIAISNEQYTRRVLSVDAQGRAAEYGLIYTINFQVDDAAGKSLIPKQKIELTRDFRFDPNAVLAKEAEEKQIRADMRQFAVHLLIRRIDAMLKQKH